MSLATIPNEVTQHIEAVLFLSKRDVLLRVLHEAERYLNAEPLETVTLLAGVTMEETSLLLNSAVLASRESDIQNWREMRNRTAHASRGQAELNKEEIRAMLSGLRKLLQRIEQTQEELNPLEDMEEKLSKIRGKYSFVATSVDQFLKRKQDDLDRETP